MEEEFPFPEEQGQYGYNQDESAHYPKFSEVHEYPDPYKNVGQRINTAPNKYANPKPKPKTNQKKK